MRSTGSPDYDAVIVGAGFSGIYLLHKLRDAGFKVLLVDAAAQPGGIWYWNCYPGARVDSQVPLYEFSIPEVWKSWAWSERFPGWKELRAYFRHVCDTLGLWPLMRMGSRVESARFDEEGRRWRLQLEGGEGISTHFLLPALGFASKPYIPDMQESRRSKAIGVTRRDGRNRVSIFRAAGSPSSALVRAECRSRRRPPNVQKS